MFQSFSFGSLLFVLLIMFIFLVFRVSGRIDKSYSLLVPIVRTNISEIGNWTLRDQAIAQKTALHLTPNYNSTKGGICQLVPTLVSDWQIEIDISLRENNFTFVLSQHLCPQIQRYFTGLNLTFTPLTTDILLISLNGVEIFGENQCKLPYNSNSTTIIVEKTQMNLAVSLSTFNNKQKCFTSSLPSVYMNPYISLFSNTPDNCSKCKADILSIRFFTTEENTFQINESLIWKNRKYLKNTVMARFMYKMKRRARMETVAKYIEESDMNLYMLDEKEVELSDSFKEVSDMINRAKECINAKNLTEFINYKLLPVVNNASLRYQNVANALWQMKNEMIGLWDKAKQDLVKMNKETQKSCDAIKNEALQFSKQITEVLQSKNMIIQLNQPKLSKYLFIICVLEFMAYVIFFITHRKRISRRKYV